tara:strand:+ start:2483 stop:3157 length:675 start_codon:yes stop_codon:yes gene_type:complete
MNRIIAILIFVLLSSCQKKENDLEFEKNVMNEIFIDLVDSIYYDIRLSPLPKEPYLEKGISDSLKNERIKKHKLFLAEREINQEKIKNDTSRIVLAVYDTIEKQSISNGNELIKFNNVEYLFDSITKKIEYKIDLSKIKRSDKFIFKYWTDFPNDRKIWRNKSPYYLGGLVSFSRIQFDKTKKHGVLKGGVGYGINDSEGFRIYIKKDLNNKWVIDKIILTSIS